MDEHDTGATRALAKSAWVLLVVLALFLLTRGLWDTTYFEPTGEALRAARQGQLVVLVAALLMMVAAGVARIVLGSPTWVVVLLVAPAVFCAAATTTDALAVLTLALAYPATVLAVLGGLMST